MNTRPNRLAVPSQASTGDRKKSRSPSSKPSGVVTKRKGKGRKQVSRGKADNGEGGRIRDKQGGDKHELEKRATDKLTDFSELMDAPQPAEGPKEPSPTWKEAIANTLKFGSHPSSGPTPPTSEPTTSPTTPKEERRGSIALPTVKQVKSKPTSSPISRSNSRADGWDKIVGLSGSTAEQPTPLSNAQREWGPKKELNDVRHKDARRKKPTGVGMHGRGNNDAASTSRSHMKSRKRSQNEAKWEEVIWSEVLKSNHPEAKNFQNFSQLPWTRRSSLGFEEQSEEQKHLHGYKIFIKSGGLRYVAKVCRPANVESKPERDKETYKPVSNHNTITIQRDDEYWHAVISCQEDLEEYVDHRERSWFKNSTSP